MHTHAYIQVKVKLLVTEVWPRI